MSPEIIIANSDPSLNYGKLLVQVNPEFFRPAEVEVLRADASRAKEVLGWEPETKFAHLVKLMVESDIEIEK